MENVNEKSKKSKLNKMRYVIHFTLGERENDQIIIIYLIDKIIRVIKLCVRPALLWDFSKRWLRRW